MNKNIKILSCPHCWGNSVVNMDNNGCHFVYCLECGASTLPRVEKEDAIKLWNMRAITKKEYEKKNNCDRLTIRANSSDMVYFIDDENKDLHLEPCEMNSHHNRLAIEKLANYEDMEEQGLLLKLPCPIGSVVWRIMYQRNYFRGETNPMISETTFCLDMINRVGKTIFLTQEEAEMALVDMEI